MKFPQDFHHKHDEWKNIKPDSKEEQSNGST